MHGLVTQLLTRCLEGVYRTTSSRSRYLGSNVSTQKIADVSEFWRLAVDWDPARPPGQYIDLTATVSTFAPTLPGVPRRKRDLHLEIRRSIPKIEAELKKRGHGVGPASIDALLGFTAGQMVFRLADRSTAYAYLGLYHSIVRNSIPLFVRQDYTTRHVIPALKENHGADTMEARIVARILPMSDEYLLDFIRETGLQEIFGKNLIASVAPRFALQVDGDDGTSIEPLGACRYLDGDIWVALRIGETERVVNRFLDLSDPEDVRLQREGLRSDAERLYGGSAVIAEYDPAHRIFDRKPILDTAAIRDQIYLDAGPKPLKKSRRDAPSSKIAQPGLILYQFNIDSKVEGVHMTKEHVQIHNVGGIVNFKASLKNVKQVIGESGLANEKRAELDSLIDELQRALKKVPPAREEDVERVSSSAGQVVAEALKEKPNRSFLKISAEGLKQAALAVKDVAPAVVEVVGTLLKILVR